MGQFSGGRSTGQLECTMESPVHFLLQQQTFSHLWPSCPLSIHPANQQVLTVHWDQRVPDLHTLPFKLPLSTAVVSNLQHSTLSYPKQVAFSLQESGAPTLWKWAQTCGCSDGKPPKNQPGTGRHRTCLRRAICKVRLNSFYLMLSMSTLFSDAISGTSGGDHISRSSAVASITALQPRHHCLALPP